MFEIKTEKFNGPLDLLLQLIDEKKMEITQVAISQVTQDYLAHIEKLSDKDPEELSDFLLLAARLLLLKSKALLPELTNEEEVDDLEKQLKLYREFVIASKKIEEMIGQGNFAFSREKPPLLTQVEFDAPANVNLAVLRDAFLLVLKRLDPLVRLPRQAIEKTISLQQTIETLKNLLSQTHQVGFKSLLQKAQSKTEIIVSFLAILELLKQKHLRVRQSENFDDIMIEKV